MPKLSSIRNPKQRIAIILAVLAGKDPTRSSRLGLTNTLPSNDFVKNGKLTEQGQKTNAALQSTLHRTRSPRHSIADIMKSLSIRTPNGLQTSVTGFSSNDDRWGVSGDVMDRNRRVVGSFRFGMDYRTKHASFDGLHIDEAQYRGEGVGARLSIASDRLFRKMGMRAVELRADGGPASVNGAMYWPRQGYDFTSPNKADYVGQEFRWYLSDAYGERSRTIQAWDALLKKRKNKPHTWDIAAFRGEGKFRDGLEFLKHHDGYDAVRSLKPGSRSDKVWKNYVSWQLMKLK